MRKKTIQIDSLVIQRSEIDTADINGEKAMMDLEKGQYFVLNGVGSRIWDIIEEPRAVGDIISDLIAEFDVDRQTCEQSTMFFLERLSNAELINIL